MKSPDEPSQMELDDILFDASTPDSDEEEAQQQQPNAAARPSRARPGDRVIRRRARKACVECHKRKVRCDVLSRGSICTNCRLDGLQCVLRAGEGKSHIVKQDFTANVEPAPYAGPTPDIMHDSRSDAPLLASSFSYANKAVPTQPWPFASQPAPTTDMLYSYYDFLEVESFTHVPSEDFKYLEFKGCFHLPCKQILDQFMEAYFKYVHPTLPLLDEGHFWDMYDNGGRRQKQPKKISLFLFRCMLFVSASYVPAATIAALGYREAVKARTVFYQRAKMLFDFDTVLDHISVAQGALLLTFYCSEREAMMNTTWLRLAIQYATAENAHLYYQDSSLTSEARAIKKRLWWCCILRDRVLPLGVRRYIHITRDVFDFTQPAFSEKDIESEFECSRVYDPQTKKKLAGIMSSLLDLCITLTDVLPVFYPVGGVKAIDFNSKTLSQIPFKIKKCRELLESWSIRTQESISLEDTWSTQNKSIYLFYELNQVYYQSARAALCQYESFILQNHAPNSTQERMRELGAEIHSVIASISESVGRIVRLDLAQFLPVSVVAYLALPIVLNSIDVQGANATSFKNESKRRQLRLYNEAMDFCHSRYSGTTGATDAINKVVASFTDAYKKAAQTQQPTTSTALMRASPNEIDDWFGVFVNQPLRYLRISLTIDMSLASGKYPGNEDLPRRLMLEDVSAQRPSIPRTLSPIVDITDLVQKDASGSDIANVNLDFFDFGIANSTPLAGTSPWNGQTVDRILEEVLGSSASMFD